MSERSASSPGRNPSEDQRRAANAYLVWPLALANIIRETDDEPIWTRLHARQALILGGVASIAYLVVLALPLILVIIAGGLTVERTILVYAIGLIVDLVVAVAYLLIVVRYAARAARGELFSIPVIATIVDRWIHTDAR